MRESGSGSLQPYRTLPMPVSTIASSVFPLLIKHLLASGVRRSSNREIVYADKLRQTYREFDARVHRLAAGLASLGIGPGDTVEIGRAHV